jgi:hypothetical protein
MSPVKNVPAVHFENISVVITFVTFKQATCEEALFYCLMWY